jgi:metal-responsive CopG/Arc/MetJ family transcriptional regulator
VYSWYDYGMKIAVSIPDDLFESAESLGKRLRVSRSRLYATALSEFLAKHQGRKLTDRLNQVYATEESRLDDRLARIQRRSVNESQW